MLKQGKIKLLILFLLIVQNTAWGQNRFLADAPKVAAQDEVFRVVFTADGEISDFSAPRFTGLEVLAGPSPSTMTSTQIINGKRTDAIEVSYTYVVRPTATGKATITPASAVINGKSYTTRTIEIDVIQGGGGQQQGGRQSSQGGAGTQGRQSTGEVSSDDIFLRLTFSKNKVVKGEPILATLKLYTRLPVAGFEDIKFPVFNGFWSQEVETPQNINFERDNVGNQIYNSAVLRKYMLLPQQTGEITVDPAEMICQVQVPMSQSGGGRSIFDGFFGPEYTVVKKRISSKGAKIHVQALPTGAPASFGGGVGKFSMNVKLSRNDLKTHEAASVMVDISGSGNINLIETPKVEFPADFEKYDIKTNNNFTNGAAGNSGKKTFELPFIPRSEGRFVIPPVEYSYYDIGAGKYVTLKSDSLVMQVAKGENSGGGVMIQGVNKQAVASLGEDIRYIHTGNPRLTRQGYFFTGSFWFFLLIAVIGAVYAGLYYYLRSREKLRGDIRRTRNKKANKIARLRLKQAQNYLKENLHAPFYEELHKALLGYISDKLAIQFADMQRDTIKETLVQKQVKEENIAGFMQLLDDCEMARYSQAGGAGAMESQYNKAIEIISNLENSL